jgi:hypothetical protein
MQYFILILAIFVVGHDIAHASPAQQKSDTVANIEKLGDAYSAQENVKEIRERESLEYQGLLKWWNEWLKPEVGANVVSVSKIGRNEIVILDDGGRCVRYRRPIPRNIVPNAPDPDCHKDCGKILITTCVKNGSVTYFHRIYNW